MAQKPQNAEVDVKTTIKQIIDRLINLPKFWKDSDTRVVLRQGLLYQEEDKKLKPRWILLFNDVLLITKPQCEFINNDTQLQDINAKLKYKWMINLSQGAIDEQPQTIHNHCKLKTHPSSPFTIRSISHGQDKEIYVSLSAKNINDRNLWINDIHKSIINLHSVTRNDLRKYAWENEYYLGTPFHAVQMKNDHMLMHVIKENEITKIKDISGHSLLHIASSVNNIKFIEKYESKLENEINERDKNGWTPIRIACDNNAIDCIDKLIKLGAHVDEYYPQDKTINPVQYKEKSLDPDDRCLLHEFCYRGNYQVVETLLSAKDVNIEALDSQGQTPLHVAASNGHEKVVVLLLQHGAPPNIGDFKGNRPLHVAASFAITRWLIVYHARLDICNNSKKFPNELWKQQSEPFIKISEQLQVSQTKLTSEIIDKESGWFDDKLSDQCLLCGDNFTLTKRRHHCRLCGLLVCAFCSNRQIQFISEQDKKTTNARACDRCFNKAHSSEDTIRKYNFNGKTYEVIPKEFVRIAVLETTKPGSYVDDDNSNNNNNNNNNNGDDDIKEENNDKNQNVSYHNHALSAPPPSSNSDDKADNSKNQNAKKTDNKHQVSQSVSTSNLAIAQANMKAAENLEKTKMLEIKSRQLKDDAQNFNTLAKQLADKYK